MTQTMFYNFNNGASGTLLQNYSIGGDETGPGWIKSPSTLGSAQNFMITSSGTVRLADGSSNGTQNFYTPNQALTYDDMEVSTKFVRVSDTGYIGLQARMSTNTGAHGGYGFHYRTFYGMQLWKYVINSGNSQLGSTVSFTPAANTFYTAYLNVSGSSTVVISGFLQRNSDGYWLTTAGTFQAAKTSCIVYSDSASDRITGGSTYRNVGLMMQAQVSNTVGYHATEFTVLEDAPAFTAGTLSSITAGYSTLTATWTAPTYGSTPYTHQLQRSLKGANSWSDIAGATSSPHTDTTVVRLTEYDYRVKYTDNTSAIVYSNTVSGVTTAAADFHLYYNGSEVTSGSVVSLGSCNVGDTVSPGFVIANSGNATLNIDQVTVGSDFSLVNDPSFVSIAAGATRSMTVSLDTSTARTYSDIFSIPSDNPITPLSFLVTGTVLSVSPPGNPTGLVAGTVTISSVELLWTIPDSTDTASLIERSPNGSTSWSVIATGAANAVSYTNTGLTDNTTYYYRVRRHNTNGYSGYSNTLSVTTPLSGVPGVPTGLVVSIQSDTDLNIMWDAADNTEEYLELQRSVDQSTWYSLPLIGKGENTFNDTCVYPATTYYYRIRAVNNVGAGGYSSIVSKTTPASYATLSNLTSFTVTNVDAWTNSFTVGGVGSNNLFVERSFDGIWYKPILLFGMGSASPYYDINIPEGSTVYYRARTLAGSGALSNWLVTTGYTMPAVASGTPNAPGVICTNTYNLNVTGATAGTFRLKISTVDEYRQPVELISNSIAYNVSAATLQSTLRTLAVYPIDSTVFVAGSNGNFQIGFNDEFSSLSVYSSSLTSYTAVVNENQTATNTTLVFASNNDSGTPFYVQTAGVSYGYFSFSNVGVCTGTSAPAVSYNLTTTKETPYFIRALAYNPTSGLYSDSSEIQHLISPSSGSALTVTIGPGKDYAYPSIFDWTTLGPGSTVTIYPNLSGSTIVGWDSLLLLSNRGTVAKPITIQGVITSGQPTIISGYNGKYYDDLSNNQFRATYLGATAGDAGFQGHCILVSRRYGQTAAYAPGNMVIKNFQLEKAYSGYSSFTGWGTDGSYPASLTYANASCGIYIAYAKNLVISNNTVIDNGQGIFAAGGQDLPYPYSESRHISNLTIQFNLIYGNGQPSRFTEHNTYIEALDTYYIGNEYREGRASFQGTHGLKDRGPGTVIAFNNFKPGTNYACDIVEAQNYMDRTLPMDRYRYTIFIGNNSYITSGSSYHIHYASDGGYSNTTARKGILYAFHNTLVREDFSFRFYTFRNMDNNVTWPTSVVDARNNIFMYNYLSGGLGLLSVSGIGYVGTNWITVNWKSASDLGNALQLGGTGNLIVGDASNNPGFNNRLNNDFTLTSGSVCLNRANIRIPRFVSNRWPLKYQYNDRSLSIRPPASGTYDLGANEYFTAYLTSSLSTLEKGASNVFITITGTSTSFSGQPFSARDSGGNVVSITSQGVSGSTIASLILNVPNYISSVIITDSGTAGSVSIPIVDTSAPTVSSAVIDSSGSRLTLTFGEPVVGVNEADYSLNSTLARSLSLVSGALTNWVFDITPIAYYGETYTYNYDGSRTVDDYGYPLAAISSGAITNNSINSVTGISITAPSGTTLSPGTPIQLYATVLGAGSPPSGRTWSLYSGTGTVSAGGIYTAPAGIFSAQTGVVQVTTENGLHYDRITLITSALPYVITGVTISPTSATLLGEETYQFTATVQGSGSLPTGITWSVDSGQGTIATGGLFTAPGAGQSVKTTIIRATTVGGWATRTAQITTPVASSGTVSGNVNIYIGIDRGKIR